MRRGKGIKFGIIGAGSMGKNHARIASVLPGVVLAGVADIRKEAVEEVSNAYDLPPYNDFVDLLPNIEAVCVATPTQTHFEIGEKCLQAGKHLLIEKPFTGVPSLAQTLINLAKERDLMLAVGLIERYNPALLKLLKEIRGEKIIGVNIQRFSPFPERVAETDVVLDMMLHDLDLLPLIIPEEITNIKAKGKKIKTELFDHVTATITFKSGAIAHVEANRVFSVRTRKIAVTTDKHMIEADLLNKRIYVRDFSTPTPSTIPVKQTDQLTGELNDFIAAIKSKGPRLESANRGLKALILAEEVKKACL